jgi:hypothetical protein
MGLGLLFGLVSLMVSLVITWMAWELFVSGRAFQCTDSGFDAAFWTSAGTHQSAGDIILPGWTWEKLRLVNGIYTIVFFGLWILGTIVPWRIAKSILRDY